MTINNIEIKITRKNIKNLNLAVHPASGSVKVSAPLWMEEEKIRNFVISKLSWIEDKLKKYKDKPQKKEEDFIDNQSHLIWGNPCLLCIHKNSQTQMMALENNMLHIYIDEMPQKELLCKILQQWDKHSVFTKAPELLETWRKKLKLAPVELTVRQMKTRWGTCCPAKRKICLNSELAKRPIKCLEYVTVHELLHFFVPNHGKDFKMLMEKHLPDWQNTKQFLDDIILPANK